MLQDAQRTSAPSAISVLMSTAVWIVMCSEPAMRAPLSGWDGPYSARTAIRPGISLSAMSISLRPQSARPMSLTAYSAATVMSGAPRTCSWELCVSGGQGEPWSCRPVRTLASRLYRPSTFGATGYKDIVMSCCARGSGGRRIALVDTVLAEAAFNEFDERGDSLRSFRAFRSQLQRRAWTSRKHQQ